MTATAIIVKVPPVREPLKVPPAKPPASLSREQQSYIVPPAPLSQEQQGYKQQGISCALATELLRKGLDLPNPAPKKIRVVVEATVDTETGDVTLDRYELR